MAIKGSLKKYDESLEAYIPVLMAQARIYWEREHYPKVEKYLGKVRNSVVNTTFGNECCARLFYAGEQV